MTLTNCPYCGTPLKKTTLGNLWCPNCGKIEEEIKSDSEETPRYIG